MVSLEVVRRTKNLDKRKAHCNLKVLTKLYPWLLKNPWGFWEKRSTLLFKVFLCSSPYISITQELDIWNQQLSRSFPQIHNYQAIIPINSNFFLTKCANLKAQLDTSITTFLAHDIPYPILRGCSWAQKELIPTSLI